MDDEIGLSTLDRFARAVDRPEPNVDLGEVGLTIALDGYPDLDVGAYLELFDRIARPLRDRIPEDTPLAVAVDILNGHLFGEWAFRGNSEDYYDPRNSYLNEVLDRRVGIPITLSVVFMEVARRVGVDVVGIGLPGHFLVEARREDRSVILDPFRGGQPLTLEDCEDLVSEVYGASLPFTEEFLQPVTKRQIAARVLNNLKMIFLSGGEAERAWPVVQKLVYLNPDSPLDRRDRGLLAHRMSRFALARDDLRYYLRRWPDAPDRSEVRASLDAVEAILSMMGRA